MKNWFQIENKLVNILVLTILIGVYLRLNHLELCNWSIFIDRDCYRSSNMFIGNAIPPLGPELLMLHIKARIIGNFAYLLMSIPLIFYKHPISVAWFTAILNISAIFLFFIFVKRYFGGRAAFISTLFFILSPLMIDISRTPTHSSMMVPFIILYYYCFFDLIINNVSVNFIPLLILWGLMFQLHFTAIFILPALCLSILLFKPQIYLRHIVIGIIALCSLFLPYLLYEISHYFPNTKLILETLLSLAGSRKEIGIIGLQTINFWFKKFFVDIKSHPGGFDRYYLIYFIILNGIFSLVLFFLGALSYIKKWSKQKVLLLFSIIMPMLIMSFFHYPYGMRSRYLIIIFPLSFIIMSLGFINIYEIIKYYGKRFSNIINIFLIFILFLFAITNIIYSYRAYNLESQLTYSQKIGCMKTNSKLSKILVCDLNVSDDFLLTRIMAKSETDYFVGQKVYIGYFFLFYKSLNKDKTEKVLSQDDYIVVIPKDYDINRLSKMFGYHIDIKKVIEDDYFRLIIYKDKGIKENFQFYLDNKIYNPYVFSESGRRN